jgi:hypothetical protein
MWRWWTSAWARRMCQKTMQLRTLARCVLCMIPNAGDHPADDRQQLALSHWRPGRTTLLHVRSLH